MQCGDRVRIKQAVAGDIGLRDTSQEGTIIQDAGRGWFVVLVDGQGSTTWRGDELEPIALTADEAEIPQSLWQIGDHVQNRRSGEVGRVIAASLATVTVNLPTGFRIWACENVKAAK